MVQTSRPQLRRGLSDYRKTVKHPSTNLFPSLENCPRLPSLSPLPPLPDRLTLYRPVQQACGGESGEHGEVSSLG